jgi:hypothetical protein
VIPVLQHLDLQNPESVCEALHAGAAANRSAPCRRGSIDLINPPGTLIATGDLHDNPLHFARLLEAANLADQASTLPRSHLTLHEIIHSDRLINDMDFSFRALARVASLKAAFPELVHTLLANHELAQIVGAGVMKHGINMVRAFDDALEHAFGEDAPPVRAAAAAFIRSMPLALRVKAPAGDAGGDILCAHSLPPLDLMDRFDPGILDRELTEEDYQPRRGSAHIMVWGRGQPPELIETLARTWRVRLFLLGHEKATTGTLALSPQALIINSDHEAGAFVRVDMNSPPLCSSSAAPTPLQS